MQRISMESRDTDEIDLRELMEGLWGQSRLILLITVLALVGAGAYAFLSKPVYESRVYLIPPKKNDIDDINYGRSKDSELTNYNVKGVYSIFVRHLQSESLRREFYNDVYLPSLNQSEGKQSGDALFSSFSKKFKVSASKEHMDQYSLVVQSNDSGQAADWLNEYIHRAKTKADVELVSNIAQEASIKIWDIERQIDSLREVARKARLDMLVKLREALKVAQAIGLNKPPIIMGNPALIVTGSMEDQLIYMRGTIALRAEIENLSTRTSDDAFMPVLPGLQANYEFYKMIKARPVDIKMYQIDGEIYASDTPIKPRKTLILILGLMSGLMLGLLVAFARVYILHGVKNGKKPTPSYPKVGGVQ